MSPAIQVKERMQELLADRDHALAEIDKLLTVAETLQDKCEARERRLELTFVVLSLGIMFVALVFLIVDPILASIPELKDARGVMNWFTLVTEVVVFSLLGTLCFQDWRRQSRDRTTIHSIVDMLREVEGAMARHAGFTALEEQHVKLRLQRFAIGPGAVAMK